MYTPIIRTKQFDLLALAAVLKADLLAPQIQPILEPVKDSAALARTITLLQKSERPFYVIDNPQVGTFKNLAEKINPFELTAAESVNVVDGQLQLPGSTVVETLVPTSPHQIQLQDLMDFSADTAEDCFFSDAHLYYRTDGFVGFSDYGISGATYYEKGFPSKVITLHVVYFDPFNNLRIKHFRSDSNDDYSQIPEKFAEAAGKLAAWVAKYREVTYISPFLDELLENFYAQHFPGLGVIKKLTTAHHLACLNYYFSQPQTKRIAKW